MSKLSENPSLFNADHLALRASMRQMLDAYWGEGDGARPPEFILEAMKLSGWTLKGYRQREAAILAQCMQVLHHGKCPMFSDPASEDCRCVELSGAGS